MYISIMQQIRITKITHQLLKDHLAKMKMLHPEAVPRPTLTSLLQDLVMDRLGGDLSVGYIDGQLVILGEDSDENNIG